MTSRTAHAFGSDALGDHDGVALAELIRTKDLSPREVVAAAVERAQAVDPAIGAIAAYSFDAALEASTDAVSGAFGGVPTFIKDQFDVAGLPTRYGSEAFEGAKPATTTAEVAQQMFDMGMVCLGKSTLPEFGLTASTEFPHDAPTRNPWNTDRSAGGSSGGAAALVAAGVVPLAHGADGGGSIRVPAACCGLVGLKASRGRLVEAPDMRRMPVRIANEGVLSRTVRDTVTFFSEAEKRFRNPDLRPIGTPAGAPGRRLRIGAISEAPTGVDIDDPTRGVFADTLELLEDLGHDVEPLAPPVSHQFADDFIHYWSMMAFAISVGGKRLFDPCFERDRLTDVSKGLARRFRSRLAATPGALRRLRRSGADYELLFGGLDIVLSPTVAHLPPPIGYLGTDLDFDTLFPRVEQWVAFTPWANAAGAPSISIPLGRDEATNLPVGMLFGASRGEDGLLLELAAEIEATRPWPTLAAVAPSG